MFDFLIHHFALCCFIFSVACLIFAVVRGEIAKKREAARIAAEAEAKRQKEEQARRNAALSAAQKAAAAAAKANEQRRKKAEQEAARAVKAAARAAREEEQARKRAEKLQAAKELAEYRERELQAARELKALQAAEKRPETISTPVPEAEKATPENVAPQAEQERPETISKNDKSFSGEMVAFTGKLPTMTRAEAIKEVQKRGGNAAQRISAGCTVLVVGESPRDTTRQKAEGWNIPTITWQEWFTRAGISWKRRQYAIAMGWL